MEKGGNDGCLEPFERDFGICQYCGEDLLWSFSAFQSRAVDCMNGSVDTCITCCKACSDVLKDCEHLTSIEERTAFVRQNAKAAVKAYRQIAEKLRPYGKYSVLGRLVHEGLINNGDIIHLKSMLPSFLLHSDCDPHFYAIVDCSLGNSSDVIHALDGSLYSLEVLTFEIFQKGHSIAPYRKTRFSWSVCPADHWVTEAGVSLSELRVRLDWDDLPSRDD